MLHAIKDIGWAAGFLEGEGYFALRGSNKKLPTISAAQVIPEPLYKLQYLFGGKVLGPYKSNHRNGNPSFRWDLHGSSAAAVMMTLYCLMSEKRKASIATAVTAWRSAPGNPATWRARGICQNGHAMTGENYIVAPSGHGRCRPCGIEGRRRYYVKNSEKWRGYATARRLRLAEN